MQHFNEQALRQHLSYRRLADRIGQYMASAVITPKRIHLDYHNPGREDSTLLLMPAWREGDYLGVKNVTITPDNGQFGLPSIHAHYLLFNATSGILLATMDGKVLTNIRTAAASLFMAKKLANPQSKHYLVVGTGNLSADYIQAFHSHFKFDNISIWGRNTAKAEAKAQSMQALGLPVTAVENLVQAQQEADIISTLTLAISPLVLHQHSRPGQHYDLVGAYKPDRREADGLLLKNAAVWVDTEFGALHEAGDIIMAINEGNFTAKNITGTIADIATTTPIFNPNTITLFKSVGHAAQDLAAAGMVYEAS